MPETVTVALRAARERLMARAIPAIDADELLSRLLGIERAALRDAHARPLTADQGVQLATWLARREAGEPVQYITGRAAFRDLDLAVDPRVLIPRPETEVLVECVLQVLRAEAGRWPRPSLLDLGTGSGAIALALAHELPEARVVGTDASPGALDVAAANAGALGLASRLELRLGDWFDPLDRDERFEAIVSNPPYLATGEWDELALEIRGHEPHAALFAGASGLDALREIVDLAPDHLVAGGVLALELSERRAHEVAAWFEGSRDWGEIQLRDDLAGEPRILIARRERGPAIAPLQWPEDRTNS